MKFDVFPRSTRNYTVVVGLIIGGLMTAFFKHRGFSRLGEYLGRFAADDAKIILRLTPDSQFVVPLADGYWNRLVCPTYKYEPEIDCVLAKISRQCKFAFVDGGANLGFWSVKASDPKYRAASTVAVEMNPSTFTALERNAQLNHGRFTIVQAALHAFDGGKAKLSDVTAHHSAACAEIDLNGNISTISLKTLLTRSAANEPGVIPVVKLDLEGAEDDVVASSQDLFNRPAVLIFEDHGNQRKSNLSARLLRDVRVQVFYIKQNGECCRIHNQLDLDGIKKNRYMGYNFIAISGDFLIDLFSK